MLVLGAVACLWVTSASKCEKMSSVYEFFWSAGHTPQSVWLIMNHEGRPKGFTATGERALVFEIFKYGRPGPLMERLFDILIKVQMASVRYLHTMRFLKEILAFISHFPQLIDAFQRMKAMAQGNLESQGDRPAKLNKKTVAITQRVKQKFTGNDFTHEKTLQVSKQVQLLIEQATSHENL